MQVILKAAHLIANRDCSARICGVLLNILNCLLDLNITKQKDPTKQPEQPIAPLPKDPKTAKENAKKEKDKEKEKKDNSSKRDSTDSNGDSKKEDRSTSLVAMETIVRYC